MNALRDFRKRDERDDRQVRDLREEIQEHRDGSQKKSPRSRSCDGDPNKQTDESKKRRAVNELGPSTGSDRGLKRRRSTERDAKKVAPEPDRTPRDHSGDSRDDDPQKQSERCKKRRAVNELEPSTGSGCGFKRRRSAERDAKEAAPEPESTPRDRRADGRADRSTRAKAKETLPRHRPNLDRAASLNSRDRPGAEVKAGTYSNGSSPTGDQRSSEPSGSTTGAVMSASVPAITGNSGSNGDSGNSHSSSSCSEAQDSSRPPKRPLEEPLETAGKKKFRVSRR
ncbi:hypothetical protein BG004_002668 [Podila humilis]|nr:hypothetical protein BG004_002668 [Podila humilis]